IIKSDDDYLYIADDFQHEDELGLLPHKFTDVFINDFKYDRYFNMDDVIYVQYSNEELERFSNGLFEDYGEIFGRMINLQLKKNQVRGILNVDELNLKEITLKNSYKSILI